MIIISTTREEEARDLREILSASLPPDWSYRIFLRGTEFASREPRAEPAAAVPVRTHRCNWRCYPGYCADPYPA